MFKITNLIVLFSFFVLTPTAYSQDKTIDSLKVVLQNPKVNDTLKLYGLSETMGAKYADTEKGYYILNEMMGKLALENYNKNSSPEFRNTYAGYLAEYYCVLAIRDSRKMNFLQAFARIDKAISLYRSAKAYENMNFAIVTKGTFYSEIQEYDKAIACLYAPLKYFETSKEKNSASGIAYVNTYIAQIYIKQKKHDKALVYYDKVLAYYKTLPNLTPQDMHEQSYVYSNMGTCYQTLGKHTEAVGFFNKSVALCQKIGDAISAEINRTKIADIKIDQQQFAEAESILTQIIARNIDLYSTVNAYLSMGEMFYKKKDFVQSDLYLTQALQMNEKVGDLTYKRTATNLLSIVSVENKNYKKALEMHKLHEKLMADEKIEQSKHALVQQQIKYDFEKKELNYKLQTEKETAAKNNWLIALSGALLLLVLGGYFYYRNNKQQQSIAALEKNQIKQKLLITQMNPHFIFNSIENIQALIYDKQDDAAVNYLSKFSVLTRQILENSNENYISLTEEVDMITNYLSIQQLLYNNKFDFHITVEESVETDAIFLPPMLTQPFIENAIKHGLSGKTSHGLVDIRFYLKDAKLFFEVLDNGKGFNASKKTENHKSLAMTITKERLINYTKNKEFVVQTDNIMGTDNDVVGAKVHFEIPYIYEN